MGPTMINDISVMVSIGCQPILFPMTLFSLSIQTNDHKTQVFNAFGSNYAFRLYSVFLLLSCSILSVWRLGLETLILTGAEWSLCGSTNKVRSWHAHTWIYLVYSLFSLLWAVTLKYIEYIIMYQFLININ